jgi:hypothetical protein
MKQLLHRCIVASLHRSGDSTIQRFYGLPVFLSAALFLSAAARAQMPLPDASAMRSSASGQFIVTAVNPVSQSIFPPVADTNADLIRIEPALLAVSAERVKQSLWRALGVDASTPWRGRIYLVLHPAASPDEDVTIISRRFADVWGYRVELPDVLSRASLARALTGAMLLELANRDNAGDRSAEIPVWLTEGLSQQLLAAGNPDIILSPPDKAVNGLPEKRIIAVKRGVDVLAEVRPVLQDQPALTFEQLSWPEDAQLRGGDGGVYRASAQLFVNNLLKLNHGPEHLRAMLRMLPDYYNWQMAFRAAFAGEFPLPVDLEKWWALQTVSFTADDAGPAWTPAVSRARLDEILSVPVEVRSSPTNLPAHSAIALQNVVRNFDSDRQTAILQTKLRDLGLVEWRMTPQFAVLADAYHRALADYLGSRSGTAPAARGAVTRPPSALSNKSAADTVGKLDALDAQLRELEKSVRPQTPTQKP